MNEDGQKDRPDLYHAKADGPNGEKWTVFWNLIFITTNVQFLS